MTHVVTGRCVDCRYTDCCTVCPVDCFWETKDPAMLVIDPETCIDCELCVPECPINAIYTESELPECYADWTENGPAARFFDHPETCGREVMAKARDMLVREIAGGLWRL